MEDDPPKLAPPKHKRRWYQFSLRTLLIVATLCAIPCVWLSVKLQHAKREREAAAAITKLNGGYGTVGWTDSYGPAWLRRLLGEDLFRHVEVVDLPWAKDVGLENLQALSQIQVLRIYNGQPFTDAGIEGIKGQMQLRELSLNATSVTDAGIAKLEGMSRLQELDLGTTEVTDAGLTAC